LFQIVEQHVYHRCRPYPSTISQHKCPFGVDRYSPELENILFDYARICRVETVMKPHMEVLV